MAWKTVVCAFQINNRENQANTNKIKQIESLQHRKKNGRKKNSSNREKKVRVCTKFVKCFESVYCKCVKILSIDNLWREKKEMMESKENKKNVKINRNYVFFFKIEIKHVCDSTMVMHEHTHIIRQARVQRYREQI